MFRDNVHLLQNLPMYQKWEYGAKHLNVLHATDYWHAEQPQQFKRPSSSAAEAAKHMRTMELKFINEIQFQAAVTEATRWLEHRNAPEPFVKNALRRHPL